MLLHTFAYDCLDSLFVCLKLFVCLFTAILMVFAVALLSIVFQGYDVCSRVFA